VGRWVDEPYYGWTWVSGDPWGWAPYHYGNWYMSSFGWAWYPGPIYGRCYWRPALVGFFGWGGGVSVGFGFGFGNVGWVPLAPFERFHPWYGRGFNGGFNNTTIVNNVRVENSFRNARFVNGRNGVTSVNTNDFGRGRAINTNNFVRASNTDLSRAGSVQGRLPFTASADARRMSDRPVNTQSMPRVNASTSFAQGSPRRNGTQGPNQRGSQGFSQGQAQGQRSPAQPTVIGGGNSGGNNGWRTFNGGTPNRATGNGSAGPNTQLNTPRGAAPSSSGSVNSNSNGGGWRTFEGNRSNARTQPNGSAQPSGPRVIGGARNSPAPVQPQGIREPAPSREIAPREIAPRQIAPRESAPRQNYQQPVRISPPIVRERAPSPQVSRPQPSSGGSSSGGFGAPRPQSGGGGGGGNRSGGGGNHGGSGGGGHRR
jgi:hypothetical protein